METINKKSTEKMDLMRLPFELAEIIFSQLKECDIIQCMSVCKHWFNHVPYYSYKIFKEVNITPSNSERKYTKKYLLHCIGSHITSLNILEVGNDVHRILKAFRDSKLTSLDIEYYHPPMIIDCLNDHSGTIINEYEATGAESANLLFSDLRTFYADSLTTLSITHHFHCTITLLDVMENFPGLTHLTLSSPLGLSDQNVRNNNKDGDYIDESKTNLYSRQVKKHSSSIYSNLIYLNIDHSFDFDLTVIPFILRCPNISHICLTALADNGTRYIDTKDANQIGRLLDAAPNLYSFISSELCYRPSEKYQSLTCSASAHLDQSRLRSPWLQSGSDNKECSKGLNVFILDQTDGQYIDESLSVVLGGSQQTLRVLDVSLEMFAFYRISTDNIPLFNVYLPHLTILRLSCLDLDPDWITALLRQSPILEEIVLNEVPNHLTQEIVDALALLSCLRRCIFSVYLSGITADPPAQQINMSKWATHISRLEEISLYNVYPTDHMLYCIGQLPSIKKFWTNHRESHGPNNTRSLVTANGFLAFAVELAKNKNKSGNRGTGSINSGLQELKLKGFNTLTDPVLEALGDVDSLIDLHICKCPITDNGLRAFLNKKAMTLKKLSLTYCKDVSEDGINYAKSILGSSNVSFLRWRHS